MLFPNLMWSLQPLYVAQPITIWHFVLCQAALMQALIHSLIQTQLNRPWLERLWSSSSEARVWWADWKQVHQPLAWPEWPSLDRLSQNALRAWEVEQRCTALDLNYCLILLQSISFHLHCGFLGFSHTERCAKPDSTPPLFASLCQDSHQAVGDIYEAIVYLHEEEEDKDLRKKGLSESGLWLMATTQDVVDRQKCFPQINSATTSVSDLTGGSAHHCEKTSGRM